MTIHQLKCQCSQLFECAGPRRGGKGDVVDGDNCSCRSIITYTGKGESRIGFLQTGRLEARKLDDTAIEIGFSSSHYMCYGIHELFTAFVKCSTFMDSMVSWNS
jgi:hypothetical protein